MPAIPDNAWHLDKKVPITMILLFVVQTMSLVYIGTSWKADIENRIQTLEKSETASSNHESRIIILEQGLMRIREDLSEIKTLLRQQKMGEVNEPSRRLTPTSAPTP